MLSNTARAHRSNTRNSTHIRILIFATISQISRNSLVNQFYVFHCSKIKKNHFKCENIFKFEVLFSNEIDFGFQFRIPLSEIICIQSSSRIGNARIGNKSSFFGKLSPPVQGTNKKFELLKLHSAKIETLYVLKGVNPF